MSTAVIEGDYRYILTRGDRPHRLLFIMLNPSTADAEEDDATIRRLRGFQRDWGYTGFTVVNLYSLRSRDPKQLKTHYDPVGPHNDTYIRRAMTKAWAPVMAWGNALPDTSRAEWFLDQFRSIDLYHLGLTRAGQPRHPLYLPSSSKPILYQGAKA